MFLLFECDVEFVEDFLNGCVVVDGFLVDFGKLELLVVFEVFVDEVVFGYVE